MADTDLNGGGNSPQTPGAAQTDTGWPQGVALPKYDEYQRLLQNNERVRGMQPYWEAGSRHGFKRPQDFDSYGKFKETLTSKGLTMDELMKATEGYTPASAQQNAGGNSGLDPAVLEKFLSEKGYMTKDSLEKERGTERARTAHMLAMERETGIKQSALSKFLDGIDNDWDKETMSAVFERNLESKRGLYPEGHPLRDSEIAALDEKVVNSVLEELVSKRNLARGKEVAAKGDAAIKSQGRPTTPAGSVSSKPDKSETKQGPPGDKDRLQAARELVERRKAQRSGGSLHSLGGS